MHLAVEIILLLHIFGLLHSFSLVDFYFLFFTTKQFLPVIIYLILTDVPVQDIFIKYIQRVQHAVLVVLDIFFGQSAVLYVGGVCDIVHAFNDLMGLSLFAAV